MMSLWRLGMSAWMLAIHRAVNSHDFRLLRGSPQQALMEPLPYK